MAYDGHHILFIYYNFFYFLNYLRKKTILIRVKNPYLRELK